MTSPLTSAILSLGATLLLASAVPAQDPVQTSPWPQTMPPQDPTRPALLPNAQDLLLQGNDVHPRFRRGDLASPAFQGFPVLAPPGFGAYPGGVLPIPFRDVGVVSPAAPVTPRSPNAWPTWIPGSTGSEEGFGPSVAIVAQTTDYVWIREPGDAAYVPLASWDRYRVVAVGAAIDVRGGGQFMLAFHRGAVVRVIGRSRVAFERLDEEVSQIGFDTLTHAVVVAGERPVRVRIGLAGVVEVLTSHVSMQHENGMVRVQNLGPGEASFSTGGADTPLPVGRSITLMPALERGPAGAALAVAGVVETEREGRVLRAEGGPGDGTVDWSGAKFEVPRGTVLRIDPLAGQAFPEGFHERR